MPEPAPSIAYAGTTTKVWPERTFTKRVKIPHAATLPILRHSTEIEVRREVEVAAEEIGIPIDLVMKQGRWVEKKLLIDNVGYIEVSFATKMFMWMKDAKVEDFNLRRKLATWSGGPRDGQEVFARNGEIVWDGPLGVLVHDQLVVWRDVGDGARAAWALMTPEERAEFRHEIEDDAEVLVSHDVEITPAYAPPEHVSPPPPDPYPDSPLAAVIKDRDWSLADLYDAIDKSAEH